MQYVSTRGNAPSLDFDDVVLAGLASDGGLYVPERWPEPIAPQDPANGYATTAAAVLEPFVQGSVVADDLAQITRDVYGSFSHPDVAPVVPLATDHVALELHWGPTLSFKDYALALIGVLFERILRERDQRALVLGATSGDTGSAAMAAMAGMESVDMVILYPEGRVSEVQRRQMTTIDASNVHAVAVPGTFDDCQDLVKAAFSSPAREEFGLAAVNSINWARIAAQAAYHMWAAAWVGGDVTMSVPTGNFGNVLSAEVARRLGAPIRRMVVANNANRGMTDLIERGRMSLGDVSATVAPAMDIGIPSNLERYLFELLGRDSTALTSALELFRSEKLLVLDEISHAGMRARFRGAAFEDVDILRAIQSAYTDQSVSLEPHTATAWLAGQAHKAEDTTLVTVVTAHPAKFPEAFKSAVGVDPELPARLKGILDRSERIERIDPTLDGLAAFLRDVRRA